MGTFEFFEHTADVGLAVEADSLEELLETAGFGIMQSLIAEPSTIVPNEERTVILGREQVQAEKADYLLFDFLNELIFLFETERFLAAKITAKQTEDGGWKFQLLGETFDPDRHPSGHEVKAITYHGLEVNNLEGRWNARVILDI